MKFGIDVQEITVYTCADGQQFHTRAEADSHNATLLMAYEAKLAEDKIRHTITSYQHHMANTQGWSERKRAQAGTVLDGFLRFMNQWDEQFIALDEYLEEPPAEVVIEDDVINIPF